MSKIKFNVGDIVTAVENAPYAITTNEGKYKVRSLIPERQEMNVVVMSHNNKCHVGRIFNVSCSDFILVNPKPEEPKEEKIESTIKDEVTFKPYKKSFIDDNKAFLNTYDTYEKQIEYYTQKMMKLLADWEVDGDFTYKGCEKNVREWYLNKAGLFDKFRGYSGWNEEAKAIVLNNSEKREMDLNTYLTGIDTLSICSCDYCGRIMYYAIRLFKTDKVDKVIDSDLEEKINDFFLERASVYTDKGKRVPKVRAGMKLSRVINYVCKNADPDFDFTSTSEFQRNFAIISDAINPSETNRTMVLSLNILDFLLMSYGNSWASCHYINSHGYKLTGGESYSGCYKAGCLSYSSDDVSMILYNLPTTYEGNEWYTQPKINRQIYAYKEGLLLQSRLYPAGKCEDLADNYRHVVQKVISECMGISNSWKLTRSHSQINEYVCGNENTFNYKDWYEYDEPKTITMSKNKDFESYNVMYVGGDSYCVDCGDLMDTSYDSAENLQCDKCVNSKVACYNCGCSHDEEDMHYIDGEYYCEDCCFYCDYHGEWEACDSYDICLDGMNVCVCGDALSELYYCEDCDEYFSSDVTEVLGSDGYHKYVCDYCLKNYTFCECCGEYVDNDDIVYVDGVSMCSSCAEEKSEVVA